MSTNTFISHTSTNATDGVLSDGIRNSSISAIKQMMYLAAAEMKKGVDIVSLSVGIPFYKMPHYIREHVQKVLFEKPDIDKYTLLTGLPKLREYIAQKITKELGLPTTEDQILMTPGSMGGLMYVMQTLLNKGDEVILFSPYFSSHAEQIRLAEGIPVEVPLIEPTRPNESYHIDLEAVKKTITKKTKAILVCNPANPTGAVLLKSELLQLARIIKNARIYLINDEVYDFLTYDGVEYFNLSSIKSLWPRVVRCWSFSKKYGMTGARLGYIHTNKELLTHILKVHDATIVCAPHITQEAGFAAISGTSKELEQNKRALQANRDLICKRLDLLSDLFSYIKPQGAYYIFPRYTIDIPSVELAKRLLYEAGVAVVPGIGFGKIGEGHLRLSFGGIPADINVAFDRIETWWIKNKKSFIALPRKKK